MIAACIHDNFCSDYQILKALCGGDSVVIDTGHLVRRRDGFFGADEVQGVRRNTGVSAVGVIADFNPWESDNVDIVVLENPNATTPWRPEVLPWRRWFGPVEQDDELSRFDWRQRAPEVR